MHQIDEREYHQLPRRLARHTRTDRAQPIRRHDLPQPPSPRGPAQNRLHRPVLPLRRARIPRPIQRAADSRDPEFDEAAARAALARALAHPAPPAVCGGSVRRRQGTACRGAHPRTHVARARLRHPPSRARPACVDAPVDHRAARTDNPPAVRAAVLLLPLRGGGGPSAAHARASYRARAGDARRAGRGRRLVAHRAEQGRARVVRRHRERVGSTTWPGGQRTAPRFAAGRCAPHGDGAAVGGEWKREQRRRVARAEDGGAFFLNCFFFVWWDANGFW